MQTAPPTPRPEPSQTTGEMLWEVADLAGGAAVMLLPLLLLAVPGIAAFVVLPAIVLLAVAAAPVDRRRGGRRADVPARPRASGAVRRHRRRSGSPRPVASGWSSGMSV